MSFRTITACGLGCRPKSGSTHSRHAIIDCTPDKWWGHAARLSHGSTLVRAPHSTHLEPSGADFLPVLFAQGTIATSSNVRCRNDERSLDIASPYCIHHGRMRPPDCHARPGLPHRGWDESAEARRA